MILGNPTLSMEGREIIVTMIFDGAQVSMCLDEYDEYFKRACKAIIPSEDVPGLMKDLIFSDMWTTKFSNVNERLNNEKKITSSVNVDTASLNGVVKTKAGAVIPNVIVKLTHKITGEEKIAVTTEDGSYTFILLPLGTYYLKFKSPGFKTNKGDQVALLSTDAVELNKELDWNYRSVEKLKDETE